MGKYLIKRILLLIPTLFIVCLTVFAMMRIVPGSAVDVIVAQMNSSGGAVDEAAVEAMLGLDKPFLEQFFTWIWNLLHGDMGNSFFQTGTVASILARELPVTLELTILTLILSNLISIPLGVFCATHIDTVSDNVVRIIAVLLMSVPVFWIATLTLVYPAIWFGYAPPTQYVSLFENPAQNLQMFLPPAILGAITTAGGQLRNVRSLILEILGQDYIRTAWAKGNRERRVLYLHAFRNTMIPVITMIGGSIGALMGGSVVLENMFNIPGIGRQLVVALNNRDYLLVQGCVLATAIVTMVINLIVDIAYKWVDPRVQIE